MRGRSSWTSLDSSIVNVALPSIRRDLRFSQQSLQWVLSGYLLTYGGFLLLGGRAADLLGRRRLLVAGTSVFALSLARGRPRRQRGGMLIGARLAQGVGAALMAPGRAVDPDHHLQRRPRPDQGARRLGRESAASPPPPASSSAACSPRGRAGAGCCSSTCPSAYSSSPPRSASSPVSGAATRPATFDVPGAVLVTGGMLLLVYALVKAPDAGWGDRHDRRARTAARRC